ncbi:MAG: NAD(P)H-hydrate dehydratase [Verrucomicrobiaceae bacterium]|nr:NAD(P)H-hydrate dehydratase [Verrucomicrobiaceae bacterium]
MLVTCEEMSAAERRLFSTGVAPEPYMEEAGRRCAEAVLDFFPEPATAEVFCGKGNNGGDALVVARHLKTRGWRVTLRFTGPADDLAELPAKKLAEFLAVPDPPGDRAGRRLVLLDGILGIGAKGALRGAARDLVGRINQLRRDAFATCFAIDIPSGLDADTGIPHEGAVVADHTLSITAAKTGFAADGAVNHVGRLVEIPLAIPVTEGDPSRAFLFPSILRPRLPRRPFDTHKGMAGRVAILAGSRGLSGAAVLTALGASRAGAGLVTVSVPEALHPLIASRCPPEVMVRPFAHPRELVDLPGDVLAIGPGLGPAIPPELLDRIYHDPRPVVVDADALNTLAEDRDRLSSLPANRLLTPHPGEIKRLVGEAAFPDRSTLARTMAETWGVTLLFKGARTLVASPDHPLEYNTTGHPGMASGGMGDVLTGVTAALIAQGVKIHDAACLGSWLLGRAAEIAVQRNGIAPESLDAVRVAEHLGAALLALQTPGSP